MRQRSTATSKSLYDSEEGWHHDPRGAFLGLVTHTEFVRTRNSQAQLRSVGQRMQADSVTSSLRARRGQNNGQREEVLGMKFGPSEGEPFWTEFLAAGRSGELLPRRLLAVLPCSCSIHGATGAPRARLQRRMMSAAIPPRSPRKPPKLRSPC